MRRHTLVLTIALLAASCSSSEDPSATYFQDAAAITTTYEAAAVGHFDEYLAALDGATAETGDAIFVDANKALFSGLAIEFGSAVASLDALTPPDDASAAHEQWLGAARALNDVFQSADGRLAGLTEADAVNDVVSELPLADLQTAYRQACADVASLATAIIACEPRSDGS